MSYNNLYNEALVRGPSLTPYSIDLVLVNIYYNKVALCVTPRTNTGSIGHVVTKYLTFNKLVWSV